MKQFLYILCAVFIFTSCLDTTESQYTPQISTSFFICNTVDTLYVRQDAKGNCLDTVGVGDTVRFSVAFDALGNSLLTARVAWDSIYTDFAIHTPDTILNILSSTSDPEAGVFHMAKERNIRWIVLPMEFVAIKAGAPQLTFTAESDSKYSPIEIKLQTPIK